MDVREYRKRFEAELDGAVRELDGPSTTAQGHAFAAGQSPRHARVVARLSSGQGDAGADVGALLDVIRNRTADPSSRREALRALQSASFLGPSFAPHQADYFSALREIANSEEPDYELREQALEILSLSQDPTARDILLAGLHDPKAALVAPVKALQFLANDDHASAAPIVRAMVDQDIDEATKAGALRLLASDPVSEPIFSRLLEDRSQSCQLRAQSATGLRLLNPDKFEQIAKQIVSDDTEDPDLRAIVLSALTHTLPRERVGSDSKFTDTVQKVASTAPLQELRSSAHGFMRAVRSK
jgi:hypothetical protein